LSYTKIRQNNKKFPAKPLIFTSLADSWPLAGAIDQHVSAERMRQSCPAGKEHS
jgi:hypothetical protein